MFFEATQEFESSLSEVQTLVEFAELNENDSHKYSTFLKSSLLLLAGKFEAFIENIAEGYLDKINSKSLPPYALPLVLRRNHILNVIKLNEPVLKSEKTEKIDSIIDEMVKIWVGRDDSQRLNLECKMSYGKHGENELNKIFRQLGFKEILSEVKIIVDNESLIDDTEIINFSATINAVTYMRNNILHQDATPSLTSKQVNKYIQEMRLFSQSLDNKLDEQLRDIEQGSR